MSYFETYAYCDGHWANRHTGQRTRWIRVLARDIHDRIVIPSNNYNCFSSIQRYKDALPIRSRTGEESEPEPVEKGDESEPDQFLDQQLHYHGLFFDFDAKPEHSETEVDCLERARTECLSVASHYLNSFDLNEAHVQAWFSGKKGFHLIIRPEPFDIRPHRHLTYIMQKVALDVMHRLDLKTLDKSVYTVSRMWRMPNSIHQSTGRFKVELSIKELRALSVEQIIKLSQSPRSSQENLRAGTPLSDVWEPDEYASIAPLMSGSKYWKEYVELYESYVDVKNFRPKLKVIQPEGKDGYPACMQDVWEGGVKAGSRGRNQLLISMTCFWKDLDLPKAEAHALARDWVDKHYPRDNEYRERIINGKTVVESVYRADKYHFSCRAMRSNKGSGPGSDIACTAPKCAWIPDPAGQEPVDPPPVALARATDGKYIDSQVTTAMQIAGIAGHPFGVPVSGKSSCRPDPENEMCLSCAMMKHRDEKGWVNHEWGLTARDRTVLKLIDVNDSQRKGAIKGHLGIPEKCHRHTLDFFKKANVVEVQVIPPVDADMEEREGITADKRRGSGHVVRRAFNLIGDNGSGGVDYIETNGKYVTYPYVFEHPKDQRLVLLFDKKENAMNDINTFKLTPDIHEQLKLFQPSAGQTAWEKLNEMHGEYEEHVHHIRGRRDLSIAVSLCYHSALGFIFQGQQMVKGWWELLVLGDSGVGKSSMVERMMAHYGLGELIAGEENKRTGLVFASIQHGGQFVLTWGKIPQNDRRLLVIDEFGAMPPEEVGKMTQLRSSGKASAQGIHAGQEAWARTRMIFLTNARNGQSLGEHNYGIDAVRDLFDEHQDLRRVDLAMCVRADDVPNDVYNQKFVPSTTGTRYSPGLCQQLVLWAWSRDSKNIKWAEGAEDRVVHWGSKLGDTYDCDIFLAKPSDLREKLARITVSVAIQLFSTHDGEDVIVTAEHADVAAEFMDQCYRKRAMAYFEYAKSYKADNLFTAERKQRVRDGLRTFPNPDALVGTLSKVRYLAKLELFDMTGYERDDADRLWKFLISNQLISRRGKGYRKTPAFTDLLKQIGSTLSGYDGGGEGEGGGGNGTGNGGSNGNGTGGGNGSGGHGAAAPPASTSSGGLWEDLKKSGETPPF